MAVEAFSEAYHRLPAAKRASALGDPASLARDATLLRAAGYRLAEVVLVDAFPDTFHVETVSRFERSGERRPACGPNAYAEQELLRVQQC